MESRTKKHYAWRIVASCAALSFSATGICMLCCGLFFAPVSADLGCRVGDMSLYMTIMNLMIIILLPAAGKLFVKWNTRMTLSVSMAIMLLAFGLMSQVTQVWHFYILGAMMGVVGPFLLYLAMPTLINVWFKKKAATAMGICGACAWLGGAVMGPVCTALINSVGWRNAYIILAAIAAVVAMPFMLFVVRGKPSDMGLLPYGSDEEEVHTQQASIATGVTPKTAFRSPSFFLMLLVGLWMMVSSTTAHMNGYGLSIGLAAGVAAMCVTFSRIGSLIGSFCIGALIDKIGLSKTVCAVAAIGVCGSLTMLFGGTAAAVMFLGAFMIGFSAAMLSSGSPMAVRTIFGSKYYSNIYSVVSMASAFFSAISLSIYGYIYDFTGSYSYDFVVTMTVLIVAATCMLLALKLGKNLKDKFE